MNKLSVVISAFNEERLIKECLESVRWAGEIIFVDNQSTDKTVEIAKIYTKKIFTRPNNLMLNINKNYAFKKATGNWILSLDADERVSKSLKHEIIKTLEQKNNNADINGYWIPRKNIIFGKFIQYTGWYPDYQLRLFRKQKGQFPEKHVHEMIKIDGKTEKLQTHILHYNYSSLNQFLQKMSDLYTDNEADNLIRNGYKFKPTDAITFPIQEFLRRYYAQKGYKDGLHGLVLSLLMAFYHLVVFAKIWEKQGFKQKRLLSANIDQELIKIEKEIKYWITKTKIQEEKNIFKKYLLKIKSWRN